MRRAAGLLKRGDETSNSARKCKMGTEVKCSAVK